MAGCSPGSVVSANASDAGHPDAAGVSDAAVPHDAAMADAGENPDAAMLSDAGAPDAQAIPDAGQGLDGAVADRPNYIFITRAAYRGDSLGGAAGANDICTNAAHIAGLPGNYVALQFTGGMLPSLGNARGWLRPDGLPVADDAAMLSAGKVWYPPILDESGAEIAGDPPGSRVAPVWNGKLNDCAGWTGGGQGSRGQAGFLAESLRPSLFDDACNTLAHLTCTGRDGAQAVAPQMAPSRLAFVASMAFPGSDNSGGFTGLQMMDHACNTEAAYQGFAGTYVAFVATTDAGALSRLPMDNGLPWSRPDGVMVLESWVSLQARGLLFAPLSYGWIHHGLTTAEYVGVITGAASEDVAAVGTVESTCGNWSGFDGDVTLLGAGVAGLPTAVFYHWPLAFVPGDRNPCTTEITSVIYCFQE